jgi:hypothetical protein
MVVATIDASIEHYQRRNPKKQEHSTTKAEPSADFGRRESSNSSKKPKKTTRFPSLSLNFHSA